MIVSLSKKHSKGTEKTIGKITDCPEASMIKYPGQHTSDWLYVLFGNRTICTMLGPGYTHDLVTKEIHGDLFYLESPGTVVTFTQL